MPELESRLKLFLSIWFSFHLWESSRSRLCTKGPGLLEDKSLGLLPHRTSHAAPWTLCIVSVPESRGHDNGVVLPGYFTLWAQNCQTQKLFLLICLHFFVLGPSNLLQMRVWDGAFQQKDRQEGRKSEASPSLCLLASRGDRIAEQEAVTGELEDVSEEKASLRKYAEFYQRSELSLNKRVT